MIKNTIETIGNTPIVKLQNIVPKDAAEVWVKLEGYNPTGSYKDRPAASILKNAIKRGDVKPGDRVIEFTGGSTGTSLAFVAAALNLKFTAVYSDAFAISKKQMMEAFGAEVIVEKSNGNGITVELLGRMKEKAFALAKKSNTHYCDQFGSPDVLLGYEPMGKEIVEAMDGKIDIFCASVGTGGALMGTMNGMNNLNVYPDIIAIEPYQSQLLTTGKGGSHKVEGIAVSANPPFLKREKLKDIKVTDQELGFKMCKTLAMKEGIFCGGSTGLNICTAIEIAKEIGHGKKIVTLGCDNGMKYLGSHIYS